MPTYGTGLVDDLLGLDRCHPDRESAGQRDPVLADRLAGDQGCGRAISRARVEVVVGEYLVEGEAVEDLNAFGGRSGRVWRRAGEQFFVVALRCLAGRLWGWTFLGWRTGCVRLD
jgi:hypothetical protein